MKATLAADLEIGMRIENTLQVFHRILDLKHGLGFYPGFFLSYLSFVAGLPDNVNQNIPCYTLSLFF
ncbi:MAG TPA: hypothetical protein VM101_10495 [Flavitalea sp.]|nr:hypothetical protein [Flavitalea sp.]